MAAVQRIRALGNAATYVFVGFPKSILKLVFQLGTLALVFPGGATYTNSPNVELSLQATDSGSGVKAGALSTI